ncbi:MAG: class II aldolase/adducin family protein [Rhodoferax sp.]|nr:class II aldolase/adducin family protein [Rhodoferax sp.]MBP9930057.1 class II aldolase/adducin family protein [Rhodoferax sp.]
MSVQTQIMPQINGLAEEAGARRELAACYRLFDFLGWTETIFNHITLRVPGEDSGRPLYLINPFGLHYGEVTPGNLVKIDFAGNDVEGSGRLVNKAGFIIHGAIHAAREDAHCIIHVHTTAGCAVACKQSGLRHDNFYSAMLYDEVAYHDYEGVTTGLDEQPRLVASLGDKNYLILRNHGLLVTGATLGEAFQRLWTLQRACEIQLASDAGQGPNHPIALEVLKQVPATRLGKQAGNEGHAQRIFDAMLRKAGIDTQRL